MKKIILATLFGAIGLVQLHAATAVDVVSLRGDHPLDSGAKMFDTKNQKKVKGGFERGWELQPPSVPHAIDTYRVTLRENTCLICHSKEGAKKVKAPALSESHYIDSKGKKLPEMSSRRWFCNQCHTPQVDAAPLVENTFQPVPFKKKNR